MVHEMAKTEVEVPEILWVSVAESEVAKVEVVAKGRWAVPPGWCGGRSQSAQRLSWENDGRW